MTQAWNAGGDFAKVVDTLEEVTIRRAGCSEAVTADAWRFSEEVTAVQETGGAVTLTETVWQMPDTAEPFDPLVGDVLIDANQRCSTITRVERLRGTTRRRVTSRRVAIDAAVAEWFDLEAPSWDEQQSPGTPVGWRTKQAALQGYEHAIGTSAEAASPSTVTSRRRLILTEPVAASVNDRFRAGSGKRLIVVSQAFRHSLGEGWSFEVVLE